MKHIFIKSISALIISTTVAFSSIAQSTSPADASGYLGDSQEFGIISLHLYYHRKRVIGNAS
ncbi:MAG: hypothetical protein R2764_04460 [Bacteroidales bacterium]